MEKSRNIITKNSSINGIPLSDYQVRQSMKSSEKSRLKSLLTTIMVILPVCILCAVLLIAAACPGKSGRTRKHEPGKKILTFWHTMNAEESATLAIMLEEFAKEYPDIIINPQPVPFDQAQNKYKIVAQAGQAPDVFRSEIAWTSEEAALGYLVCLDEYLTPENRADYLEAPFLYNIYEGKTYGIPQVTDCLALMYNRRLFREAGVEVPETMEEFREVCLKLTLDDKGRNAADPQFDPSRIKQYGFYFNGKAFFFQPFMWAFGGGLLDPDTKEIMVNNSSTVAAINFLIELRDRDRVIPSQFDPGSAYDNMMAGFKTGQYAIITNGPWATSDVLSGAEFKDSDNLGIAVIPRGPGGYGSPVGGHNLVISKSCPYPEDAYKFIAFLNRPENQVLLAVRNNLLPTRKSVYSMPGVADNRILLEFKKQLDVAKNRPVVPQGGLIYNDFDPFFQAAYLKSTSGKPAMEPQEAMDEVARSWRKLMGW